MQWVNWGVVPVLGHGFGSVALCCRYFQNSLFEAVV